MLVQVEFLDQWDLLGLEEKGGLKDMRDQV